MPEYHNTIADLYYDCWQKNALIYCPSTMVCDIQIYVDIITCPSDQ